MTTAEKPQLTRKDFVPPVDVRWCPGCGDYAILNSIQKVFPELGIPKENFVVVSGIGCSSRFPYYMDTYGFHSIHGRAPTVVTGIKAANPDLSVWMITGDGDGLSIGGNHLMHILRRNVDVNILLFNNKIYGLTKGQYSPTSEVGKTTKTSPMGSLDNPINPLSFALASEATFVARTVDTNNKHMASVFTEAAKHKGASFIEVLQNCVIFNDKAWEGVAARDVRDDNLLMLEHGQPLLFGKERNKGIRLKGFEPEVVTLGENGVTESDILIHDAHSSSPAYSYMLSQLQHPDFPIPMGVLRDISGPTVYEEELDKQVQTDIQNRGQGDVQALLQGTDFWEVQ
jgi:2-oxoglutarate ferredoxin oxidoreductase subunit beta